MKEDISEDPSWETFNHLVEVIGGGTSAENAFQIQTGWAAKWLWGSSITTLLIADALRNEGKHSEAGLMEIRADERRKVAVELLEELRKLKSSISGEKRK